MPRLKLAIDNDDALSFEVSHCKVHDVSDVLSSIILYSNIFHLSPRYRRLLKLSVCPHTRAPDDIFAQVACAQIEDPMSSSQGELPRVAT